MTTVVRQGGPLHPVVFRALLSRDAADFDLGSLARSCRVRCADQSEVARGVRRLYGACFTPGIVHVPSNKEGGVSFGQYSRSIRTNLSAGAGSQLDSLSLPGFSCCR